MIRLLRLASQLFVCCLPWTLRRQVLIKVFGYEIHRTARIRLSWVFPGHLVMHANSQIGPLVSAIHLDRMIVGEHSTIGRQTWITGYPSGGQSEHFAHQPERRSELILGDHSAITKNNHLDCTNTITIGDFVTVAGYRSQFLTHSIDIAACRQSSKPITIGDYCFVGTQAVVLGGASLPDRCVLGACSLLNKAFHTRSARCTPESPPAQFVSCRNSPDTFIVKSASFTSDRVQEPSYA